jgi:hypothetical protein
VGLPEETMSGRTRRAIPTGKAERKVVLVMRRGNRQTWTGQLSRAVRISYAASPDPVSGATPTVTAGQVVSGVRFRADNVRCHKNRTQTSRRAGGNRSHRAAKGSGPTQHRRADRQSNRRRDCGGGRSSGSAQFLPQRCHIGAILHCGDNRPSQCHGEQYDYSQPSCPRRDSSRAKGHYVRWRFRLHSAIRRRLIRLVNSLITGCSTRPNRHAVRRRPRVVLDR